MLEVRNLIIARGALPMLAGINLSLASGQALVLRGPNGSGKTTLLRTLAGLQKPLSGKVNDIEDEIAYAGHADGLKSALSVAENLQFWAAIYGQTDIAPALDAYGLKPLADRAAGLLSAGQKRRVGLARLLVTGRRLWLLDEPTVSLDDDAVTMFANAVIAHLKDGGSAVMATHIELGLKAQSLDLKPFQVSEASRLGASDEAFL